MANTTVTTMTTIEFDFTDSQFAQVTFLHSARTVFSQALALWKKDGLSDFLGALSAVFSGGGLVFVFSHLQKAP